MLYKSTRGQVSGVTFKDAVMMGLADDGGLLLPEELPHFSAEELDAFRSLPYPQLAFEIIARFATDIPADDLREMITRSYATFTHPEITPVVHQDGLYILELFHGPTLAFKDVALQLLGNLFEYLLKERGQKMNILGATSGDTGSAAIYGVRGKENIQIFILHPHGRVSPIQELQMTTVTDANVHNLAIQGTFDDGQRIVKEIFADVDFKSRYALGAVNSINWARVLAQTVYYFYAWGQVTRPGARDSVCFSVPTGNFGDIFAGFLAKRMGLPVDKLVLATNRNNILARFVNDGDYSLDEVVQTWSPSMDIQVASNFERYLYYLLDEDAAAVNAALQTFQNERRLSFSAAQIERIRQDFLAHAVDNDATLETIGAFHAATGYVLDPHTAVGIAAGQKLCPEGTPLVCLATAHPAKFDEAVVKAIGHAPQRPASLAGIEQRDRRVDIIPAETDAVRDYLAERAI